MSFLLPSVGRKYCLHLRMAAAPTHWRLSVVCMPSVVKKSVYSVVALGSSAGVTKLGFHVNSLMGSSNNVTRYNLRVQEILELGLHAGFRLIVGKVDRCDEARGKQYRKSKADIHFLSRVAKRTFKESVSRASVT